MKGILTKNICNTFSIKIQIPYLKHTTQVKILIVFFCSIQSYVSESSSHIYINRGLSSFGCGCGCSRGQSQAKY